MSVRPSTGSVEPPLSNTDHHTLWARDKESRYKVGAPIPLIREIDLIMEEVNACKDEFVATLSR